MGQNYNEVIEGMTLGRLKEILRSIRDIKVGLLGDICLDIYWRADMTKSELSRETPHFPLPVVEEWASPGGGGNALANISALKPSKIYTTGVIGDDWRGALLLKELKKRDIDTSKILLSSTRVTPSYCKPLRKGISDTEYEDPRIDFDNYSPISSEDEERILDYLGEIADSSDVLCICDQLKFGCVTEKVIKEINEVLCKKIKIVVDSRNRIDSYRNVILKPNEIEGMKPYISKEKEGTSSIDEQISASLKLNISNNAEVCMTLGERGCLYCKGRDQLMYIPSYRVELPIDICGAGDTFLSAFSCALAAGAKEYEAVVFAHLASNVVLKKIGMTGTAEGKEIIDAFEKVYNDSGSNIHFPVYILNI